PELESDHERLTPSRAPVLSRGARAHCTSTRTGRVTRSRSRHDRHRPARRTPSRRGSARRTDSASDCRVQRRPRGARRARPVRGHRRGAAEDRTHPRNLHGHSGTPDRARPAVADLPRHAPPRPLPEFIDQIARRLTDRNAIFHASSAPNAAPETLRYLAAHPSAPKATLETVAERLGMPPLSVA